MNNKLSEDVDFDPLLTSRRDNMVIPNISPAPKNRVVPKLDPKKMFAFKTRSDDAIEDEVIEGPQSWSDFDQYGFLGKSSWETRERCMSEIFEINKIIKYFYNEVVVKKTPFREVKTALSIMYDDGVHSLQSFEILQNYYDLLKKGRFSWQSESTHDLIHIGMLLGGHTDFYHAIDCQYINTSLFQLLFPVDLIDMFVSVVYRDYQSELELSIIVQLQSCMMEKLLWQHLKSDFRFHPSLKTSNLNIIDPFLRNLIRRRANDNKSLKSKYFNSEFNLKKFVFKLLDKYFPLVTVRSIHIEHKMQLLTLQLILMMFKLGLWELKELDNLITVLIQKLENLLLIELFCYKEFPLTDPMYRYFVRGYFVSCREKAVSICIHIVVLINDASLEESLHLFNNSKKLDLKHNKRLWKKAHFNNSDLSEKTMRLLTSFIMKTKVEGEDLNFTASALQNITDLFKIMTSIENDMFYLSSKVVTQDTLDFYSKPIQTRHDEIASEFMKKFTDLLDRLANNFTDKVRLSIQKQIVKLLEALDNELTLREKSLKYALSLHSIPKVLLSIFSMVVWLDNCKKCEEKCSSMLGRLLKDNPIGQAIMFDEAGMKHIKILFETKPFIAIVLIENIFKDNYNLFYVQRSLCEQFFGFFRALEDKLMYNFKTTSIEWRGLYLEDAGDPELKKIQKTLEDTKWWAVCDANIFQSPEGLISGTYSHKGREETCFLDGLVNEDGNLIIKQVYKNSEFSLVSKLQSDGKFSSPLYGDPELNGLYKFQTNMKVHATNYEAKMKQLIDNTVHSKDTSKFELLLAYFMFCRWLDGLVDQRDSNFDAKFMELSLQEIIESSFFNCMLKIITNKDFLPRTAAGGIDFEPQLMTASVIDMRLAMGRYEQVCKRDGLRDAEAKGILFEVAIMILNLMNKTCGRLYMHHVYAKASTQLTTILDDTEYMFGMTNGLEYRTAVVELYTLFYVFPNNHLIAGREKVFKTEGSSTSEESILESHLSPEKGISQVIVKEIERAATKRDGLGEVDSEKGKHYLFKGLFPMIYKYLRGVLAYYAKYNSISTVKQTVDNLHNALGKHASAIGKLFEVKLTFETTFDGNLIESSASIKNLYPTRYKDYDARDWDEIQYPELHFFRNKIIGICDKIKAAYLEHPNAAWQKQFDTLEGLTSVPTVLTAKSSFEMPIIHEESDPIDPQSTMPIEDSKNSEDRRSLSLAAFGLIMEEYAVRKRAKLTEAKHQDSMIQFLESDATNTEAIVSFFALITENYFKQCFIEPYKDGLGVLNIVEPDGVEKAADRYVMTYLQNDVLYSYVGFLDMILNDCVMLKEALYGSCKDGGKGQRFIMIMNFVMLNLGSLTIYKTFHDSDHRLLSERHATLCSFFKNLCENNFQKFKKYFGETEPQLPNVQDYFLKESSVLLDNGTRMMDIFLNNFNVESTRTSNVLTLADPVQNYPNLQHIIRWVAECLCGPCEDNQMQLFGRTHDVFLNVVERVVDNVNSNLYGLKNTILDYFIALTEDNPKVVTYFAKFITFDIIFTLMYTLLKRLYIYATVSHSEKNYRAIVLKAEKMYTDRKNMISKFKKLKGEDNDSEEFSFYSSSPTIETKYSPTIGEGHMVSFDSTNPSIITKEMEDCITVSRYQDIMKVYLRKAVFSEHILMQIVLKLNTMLINFSKEPGAHKFNLDNVRQAMINKYTDEVPMYIRKRFTGVEMNNAKDSDEKHVFYMFLTKITAEIELRNPAKNGEKVKTLYQLKPCTFFLTDHTKYDFESDIKQGEMVNVLIEKKDSFEIEMKDNLKLFRRYPKLYKLSSDDSFWYFKLALWILGFALNLLLLIFYRRDAEPHRFVFVTAKHFEEEGQYPILILAIIIFGLSLAALVVWLLARYRQKASIISLEYHKKEQMPLFGHNRALRFFIIYIWEPFHSQSYPIVFSFHILSCLLGIVASPFFLTLQLLCIVSISKTTNYVVQAITTHFDQMALTFFLAGLVIYSYSVLTTEYFFDSLESNSPDKVVNCKHMWECLMFHVNHGLRNDGGIGSMMRDADPSKGAGQYLSRFFYDMIFFILIKVVALNIVFGIIIETFTAMREDYEERAKRIDIEREGENFQIHVNHDHTLWNYSSYMFYLKAKGREEQTGLEGIIWDNIVSMKTLWIPHWTDEDDEKTENVLDKIGELDSKVELLYKQFESCVKSEDKIEKKLDEKFAQVLKTIFESESDPQVEAAKAEEEVPKGGEYILRADRKVEAILQETEVL